MSDSQFQPCASQGLDTLCLIALLVAGGFALTSLTLLEPLYALPASALLLLTFTLRRLDPRRYALVAEPGGLWSVHREAVGRGRARSELCFIANRSRLPGLLWLECRVSSQPLGQGRRRPLFAVLLLPVDSLSQERWRALRRSLNLQARTADSG